MKKIILMATLACAAASAYAAWPLSLKQAQQCLFTNNIDIAIADKEYSKKTAELSESRALWYPSLDAAGSFIYQSKRNSVSLNLPAPIGAVNQSIGTFDRDELGIDLSYPITAALVNIHNVKYRNIGLKIKQAQNDGLKNMLSMKLGALYFTWEMATKQLTVQTMLVNQLDSTVAQLTSMQQSGISTSSRVLDAQARLENARVVVLGLENQTDSLKRELLTLINYDSPSDVLPQEYAFCVDSAGLRILDTLTVNINRPEITALDLSANQLSVYNQMLLGQKYPLLVCSAGYRYGKPGVAMGGTEFMNYTVASVQLKFNIFDGFKVSSQRQQVREQIDIVAQQKEQMLHTWNNAITTARMQYAKAKKQEAAAKTALLAAQAFLTDAKNALDAGTGTSLDYLNAVTGEASAHLGVAQAQYAQKMALLQLFYVAGNDVRF